MPVTTFEVLPFLKWAGGKRWLVANHSDLFPDSFQRYIEPFLGSGAVFFHMRPNCALLSDINDELINAYNAIKSDWRKVYECLRSHQRRHSFSYYYKVRSVCPLSPYSRAARLLYLNRTCWNGLYRVNLRGRFNVPIGSKTSVLLKTDDFQEIASLLRKAEVKCGDFEPLINSAQEGDFIFIDPPYTINHNLNGFIKYNEKLFSWNDQIRLRDCLVRARQRGVDMLITNAHHYSLRELYRDFGEHIVVSRPSVLAADSSKRRMCEELIIKT